MLAAETIGLLNQKFFERRVETIFNSPWLRSRVFSKNFMRQLHDGTTQVHKVARNGCAPITQHSSHFIAAFTSAHSSITLMA